MTEMDEREWQPVRIAKLEDNKQFTYQDCDGVPWPEGRIVRVKVVPGVFCDAGGRGFKVHPDDEWSPGYLICEHQILAD